MSLKYGRLKFSKMAAGRHLEFDPTGNGAVGTAVPENIIAILYHYMAISYSLSACNDE